MTEQAPYSLEALPDHRIGLVAGAVRHITRPAYEQLVELQHESLMRPGNGKERVGTFVHDDGTLIDIHRDTAEAQAELGGARTYDIMLRQADSSEPAEAPAYRSFVIPPAYLPPAEFQFKYDGPIVTTLYSINAATPPAELPESMQRLYRLFGNRLEVVQDEPQGPTYLRTSKGGRKADVAVDAQSTLGYLVSTDHEIAFQADKYVQEETDKEYGKVRNRIMNGILKKISPEEVAGVRLSEEKRQRKIFFEKLSKVDTRNQQ
jgi:hypothetical protein